MRDSCTLFDKDVRDHRNIQPADDALLELRMKELRAYTPRDIGLLWAGGLVAVVCLVAAAGCVGRQGAKVQLNDFARSIVVYRAHDEKVAADFVAYARAHPNDAEAQAEARSHTEALARSAKSDSVWSDFVRRGAVDTAFDVDARSPRATLAHFMEFVASTALFWMAVAVPLVLAGVTTWWAFARPPSVEH